MNVSKLFWCNEKKNISILITIQWWLLTGFSEPTLTSPGIRVLVDELQMWRHPGEHVAGRGAAIVVTEWDNSDLRESAVDVGNKSSWSLKFSLEFLGPLSINRSKAGSFWNETEKMGEH